MHVPSPFGILEMEKATTKASEDDIYQNKFGEQSQNMSSIVTTAEYNRFYIIVYILRWHGRLLAKVTKTTNILIHTCVHLDR